MNWLQKDLNKGFKKNKMKVKCIQGKSSMSSLFDLEEDKIYEAEEDGDTYIINSFGYMPGRFIKVDTEEEKESLFTRVKCINNDLCDIPLVNGKIYDVAEEDSSYYTLVDYSEWPIKKSRFEVVTQKESK
jgi:hypothetical protein